VYQEITTIFTQNYAMGRPRKLQQMKERSFSFTPFGSQRSRNLAKVARCRAKSSGVPGKSIFSAVLKGVECRAKVKTAPMFVKTKALFIKTKTLFDKSAALFWLFQTFCVLLYANHTKSSKKLCTQSISKGKFPT
jgi:hypothetical protein